MDKQPVYIIIPVHNRKSITLQCLKTLANNGDLDKYHVVIVDDGSTDGTSESVASLYPEVTILAGDGNLWWTGAIVKGMEYAYQRGAEFFIWLNDDCYPEKGAIDRLLEICRSGNKIMAGGQCLDPDTSKPSYGGIQVINGKIVPVHATNTSLVECDGLAGNLVCICRNLVEEIHFPDFHLFPQYYGDVTYSHFAKKRGYKLLICLEAKAFCKNDHPVVSWLHPDRPFLEYWKQYFQIKSPFYWKAELAYYREIFSHKGILIYFYQRVIKFILFGILNLLTDTRTRAFLKRNLQKLSR